MRVIKFSLNKFDDRIDTFEEKEFSRFKHGSKSAAKKFGKSLANGFIKSPEFIKELPNLITKPLVITGAAYKFAPTASNALKDYFVQYFNHTYVQLSGSSIIDHKITRHHSYVADVDYSALSDPKLRATLITSDNLYIDKAFFEDKNIIMIDDIRITGGHENRLLELLEKNDYQGTVYFLTFAEYTSTLTPEIEAVLNNFAVKSLLDINDIIRNDEFIFNTRVVKFILSSRFEEFKTFIEYQSIDFRHQLIHCANGNEYFKHEKYKQNYNFLIKNFI